MKATSVIDRADHTLTVPIGTVVRPAPRTNTVNRCPESRRLSRLGRMFEIWERWKRGRIPQHTRRNENQPGRNNSASRKFSSKIQRKCLDQLPRSSAATHAYRKTTMHIYAKDSAVQLFVARTCASWPGPIQDKKANPTAAGVQNARPLSNGHRKPVTPTVYRVLARTPPQRIPGLPRGCQSGSGLGTTR